jgi:hypothetical protein
LPENPLFLPSMTKTEVPCGAHLGHTWDRKRLASQRHVIAARKRIADAYPCPVDFDFLDTDDETTTADEVEAMRRGESSLPDAEAALILADKVSSLMTSVATGGPQIKSVDADYKREHRALRAVLRRLEIEYTEKDDIRAYAEGQLGEAVVHLEKVGSELVGCHKSHQLLRPKDFKSRDVVLTFHVGAHAARVVAARAASASPTGTGCSAAGIVAPLAAGV